MRVLTTCLVFTLVTVASAHAAALTGEQVMGVQKAIQAMRCTVEDTAITTQEGGGFTADDVSCEDGKYAIQLDDDFGVADKDKK